MTSLPGAARRIGAGLVVTLAPACVGPPPIEAPAELDERAAVYPVVEYVRTEGRPGRPVDVVELRVPEEPVYEAVGFQLESLLAMRQNLVDGQWVDRPAMVLCGTGLGEWTLPPGASLEVRKSRSSLIEDPPQVRITRIGVRMKRESTDDWFIAWSSPFLLEGSWVSNDSRAPRDQEGP